MPARCREKAGRTATPTGDPMPPAVHAVGLFGRSAKVPFAERDFEARSRRAKRDGGDGWPGAGDGSHAPLTRVRRDVATASPGSRDVSGTRLSEAGVRSGAPAREARVSRGTALVRRSNVSIGRGCTTGRCFPRYPDRRGCGTENGGPGRPSRTACGRPSSMSSRTDGDAGRPGEERLRPPSALAHAPARVGPTASLDRPASMVGAHRRSSAGGPARRRSHRRAPPERRADGRPGGACAGEHATEPRASRTRSARWRGPHSSGSGWSDRFEARRPNDREHHARPDGWRDLLCGDPLGFEFGPGPDGTKGGTPHRQARQRSGRPTVSHACGAPRRNLRAVRASPAPSGGCGTAHARGRR